MRRRGTIAVGAAVAAAALVAALAPMTDAHAQGNGRGGGYGNGGQGGGYGRGTEEIARGAGWEARLRTDRSQYPAGRGVELTLLLTNTSPRRQELLPTGTAPEYALTVRDARTNRIVWTTSKKRSFIGLNPNETRASREFWDQRDNQGQRVPSGSYRIEARVYPNLVMNTTVYLQDGGGGGGRDEDDNGRPGGGGGRPGRPGIPGDLDPFPGRPGGGGGGYRPGRPGGGGGGGNANPFVRGEVRADRTAVRPGDRIALTFTVQNASRDRQNYRFTSSRQYDFEVRDRRGQTVWQYTQGMRFMQAFTDFSLDPGQSKIFSAVWTVERGLAPGTYDVTAYLPTMNGQVAESRTRIEVK